MRHYFERVWVVLGGWDIFCVGGGGWQCMGHYFGCVDDE